MESTEKPSVDRLAEVEEPIWKAQEPLEIESLHLQKKEHITLDLVTEKICNGDIFLAMVK